MLINGNRRGGGGLIKPFTFQGKGELWSLLETHSWLSSTINTWFTKKNGECSCFERFVQDRIRYAAREFDGKAPGGIAIHPLLMCGCNRQTLYLLACFPSPNRFVFLKVLVGEIIRHQIIADESSAVVLSLTGNL